VTDPDEVRKQAEYERLTRAAHVSRVRGDYAQAALEIKRVLELRPDDLEAREFAADILFARGELEKAAEHYRTISEADPSRASAEEKFAKATLQIAEVKRQKDLLRQMIEDPTAFRSQYQPPPRSPIAAAVLSGIPGLGHVYCGQVVKGIVIFAGAALSWLFFFALRPNVSYVPPNQRIEMFLKNLDPLTIVFLCAAVAIQMYAFVDAAVTAEKTGKSPKDLAEPR
jgi:tetratricopeptide (TPR) repeat protein